MTGPAKPTIPEVSIGDASREPQINRWLALLYVAFCFEMGVFLLVYPWVSAWYNNFFMGRYLWISVIFENYYVRGAISGLGLVDIFLAFYEVWRMRGALGLARTRAVS